MLTQLKKLRMIAMKQKDSVARYAYEAVITECDRKRGQVGRDLDESEIIKIVKKEIGKYKEMDGKQPEIDLLDVFVPKMLSDDELLNILSGLDVKFNNPKEAMNVLDQSYKDRYNKSFVAKFVLGK